MAMLVQGVPRVQDSIDAVRGSTKCRIPQRLPSGRNKPPFNNVSRPKGETTKQKFEVITAQHNRFAAKTAVRPRFDEQPRPKSANRVKDDLFTARFPHPPSRFPRTERIPANPKRPSTIPKMTINEAAVSNKTTRPLIMVPLTQRPHGKNMHTIKNTSGLPNQETIKKHEDLELRHSEISDATHGFNDYDKESITSRSDKDKVMELKISWQEKMVQFEQMKNELTDRQKAILELYAVLYRTYQNMSSLGEKTTLPVEDLRIMNVTKMTPEQLLRLCAENVSFEDRSQSRDIQAVNKNAISIDVQKLYNMPSKLVYTCEQTLFKRKEIIDWFESLTTQDKATQDKGIPRKELLKKVNEFYAENDMLQSSLEQVKANCVKELEEIVTYLRKSVNDTMVLQVRNEELTYELSELNSQNADLRKQFHNADNLRSHTNKARVEELQKELKEEKCKRMMMKDRLSRAEGQVKMNEERASQLEATLEQAQSNVWSLERTVQHLHEQNKKMQSEFDTLTESIKEHTAHLEEIANARTTLQSEKVDLEKRLTELADHYNESLKNVKQEMSNNLLKLIESEKKCKQEEADKTMLEAKVETLCAQLLDAKLRLKDATHQIQEKNNEIDRTLNTQSDLEAMKQELYEARSELIDYKNGLAKQNEVIEEMERTYKKTINEQQTLKCDLSAKEEYITQLEKKQSLLEQQLQENESKMEAYVEQLNSLKTHITQLQEDFGEFENLNELYEKINHQRAQLLEATRQNGELAEALQVKEEKLEQLSTALTEQESSIEQREEIIKILSEKEEEQSNIIKILRNNLELRSQADNNFNQQISEKNLEINALLMDIDNGKQQMSNLEKIIITLQEQTQKASIQKKKDQDKITMLQSKIAEYEAYRVETSHIIDAPTENLDNLIKIIEDELGSPMDPQTKDHEYVLSKSKYTGERKRDKHDIQEEMNTSTYQSEPGKYPAKFDLGNFVKKEYNSANGRQYEGDNLDRKKAITSIDTQKWMTAPKSNINAYNPHGTRDLPNFKASVREEQIKPYLTRNLQYLSLNQARDDRKYKMYKLAGHRL